MNKKSTWKKYALISLLCLVTASAFGIHRLVYREITVDIGHYSTLDQEQRAALQRLALEMKKHPHASAIRITAGKSAWRKSVMGYARTLPNGHNQIFWVDDRFTSPTVGFVNGKLQGLGMFRLTSEEPIYVVAKRHGNSEDVFRYNQQLLHPDGGH